MTRQTKKSSASQIALVRSSRSAILGTGISAPYFDKHFRLIRVVDNVSDRRVMWKYSVGEYETVLNDAVGFYTNEKGQRVNIHSIRNTLSTAHDVTRTIPKKRAEKLMLQCIGKYTLGSVLFQSFGSTLRASLILTASSVVTPREVNRKEERIERPVVITGFIDLETGTCTKGIAQAGHPRPVK